MLSNLSSSRYGNPMFIHLRTHSAYSLAEGAIKIKDLIARCRELDMPAVAVTDTNNLFGAMEFASEAIKNGIQPIMGATVQIEDAGKLVLLVQNETGWLNICKLLSDAFLLPESNESAHVTWEGLAAHAEGLICIAGDILVSQDIAQLKSAFGNRLYIELQRHGLVEEDAIEAQLVDLAYAHDIPLVATNCAYFLERDMHEAHDALLCIAEGRYISEDNRRKVTGEHYFKSSDELAELFKDVPEAIENTYAIARRCAFLLKPIDPILPRFADDEAEELKRQSRDGLDWRLSQITFETPEDRQAYYDRLDFELDVIIKMGFPGYFLIVSDFIKWAKAQNIPVGPGRGSGAGSVVAWSLKITDLDPLEFGLLFERFLNPERVSMPDFDVDFCQERRDEVIRYVQEKYGRDRVAQIITFGKLQARAVVRDVGRVLQMSYGAVDRIAKMIPNNPASPVTLAEALEQDPELRNERHKDPTADRLITIALQLEGLYRHASTHAAGVVIGDRPLHELVPLYRDPRSDMPVTQFNMKYVEQAGLVKFDFLGLKTMTVIQKTIDMLNAKNTDKIELLKIPFDDEKTFQLITEGKTVGVFQLESAGMRDTLRRMKPNRLDDITALVSLYRPGPMDNIPTYCARKAGEEEPDYMHEKLAPFLTETYGIMIYQEQVMQAAQALAGYTLGGADLLRRAMGKKIKEEMDAQRQKFIQGAAKHNKVPAQKAEEIFEQINKFAGYGFNKSHGAAYAVIAYWTAYLKANYPHEFIAASMTLDLGNTDKLAVFKQDLDKMGITLELPDVNYSEVTFAVETPTRLDSAPADSRGAGKVIRYALAALKGVGQGAMEKLVSERKEKGGYTSLDDFAERIDAKSLNRRQVEQLAAAGAFQSIEPSRAKVAENAEIILRHAAALADERESGQSSLFGGMGDAVSIQKLPPLAEARWDNLELLKREFEAIGFYLSAHPLDSNRAQFERMGIVHYADIETLLADQPVASVKMAGILLKKVEKVSAKSGNKFAFLQISDPTAVYEVMIFTETLTSAREILEPGRSLLLTGSVEAREDQPRFTIGNIRALDTILEQNLREVRIIMDTPDSLPKLHEFLKIEGHGDTSIVLNIPAGEQKRADIALKGQWNLSFGARNILRSAKGVREVREL